MTCVSRGHNGPLPAYLEKESCYFIKQGAHHVCVKKNIFIKILIRKFQQSTLKVATQNEDPEQRPLDLVGKLTQLSQGFGDGGSLFLTFLSMYHPGEFLTRMDCLLGEKTLSSLGNHIYSFPVDSATPLSMGWLWLNTITQNQNKRQAVIWTLERRRELGRGAEG